VWGQSVDEPSVVEIQYLLNYETLKDSALLDTLRHKTEIKIGASLSRYNIRKSIESIYSIGQFSQITVLESAMEGGVLLKFQLTNKTRIRQIQFNGTRLDKNQLLEAIKSRKGKEYSKPVALRDEQRILELYKDYGYFQAKVRFIPPPDSPLTNEVDVLYEINEGSPAPIEEIQFEGVSAIKSDQLDDLLQSKVGKAYQKRTVEDDMSRIRAFYRKKGYLTVQVKSRLDYHDSSNAVSLIFNVSEGKEVIVELKGDGFDEGELRKGLSLFKQNNYSDRTLRSTAQQIRQIYQQKGYYAPKVEYHIVRESERQVVIRFDINLGAAPRIAKITFEGNTQFKASTLLDQMTTRPRSLLALPGLGWLFSKGIFNPNTFETDRRALELFYKKAGYPEALVKTEQKIDKNRLSLYVKIQEGTQELIHRCLLQGLLFRVKLEFQKDLDNGVISDDLRQEFKYIGTSLSQNASVAVVKEGHDWQIKDNEKIYPVKKEGETLDIYLPGNDTLKKDLSPSRLAAKPGEPYSKEIAVNDQLYLQSLYEQKGYIYASIQPDYHPKTGTLIYQILGEKQSRFGKFYFPGERRTKQKVLEREFKTLGLYEGAIYRPDKLVEVYQQLFMLGLFRTVNIKTPERVEGKQVLDVITRVEEKKPGSVSLGGGYSPSEGVRGTIGLTHNNLYKRNMKASAKFRIGTQGNLYEATLIEPWFIGRTIGSARLFEDNLEEQDNIRAQGGTASLAKRLGLSSNLAIQYKYQALRPTTGGDGLSEERREALTTTVGSLGASFHRDTRDSFLNPKNGWLNEFGVEYAGGIMGGETSFVKVTTDNRFYWQFQGDMVLASAIRLGYAEGLRSTREQGITSFERFRAGGSTTVRGYVERSLGPINEFGNHRGDVMFIFNADLRFPIYKPVGGVLFFDTGNVWDKFSEISDDLPHSAIGGGIRVDTPLGPARLDYGIPLTKVFSHRIYLELGHAF